MVDVEFVFGQEDSAVGCDTSVHQGEMQTPQSGSRQSQLPATQQPVSHSRDRQLSSTGILDILLQGRATFLYLERNNFYVAVH